MLLITNLKDTCALMIHDLLTCCNKPIDVYVLNERCDVWSKTSIGPYSLRSIGIYLVPDSNMCFRSLMLRCFNNGDSNLLASNDYKLHLLNTLTHTIENISHDNPQVRKSKYLINGCDFYVYGCTYSESLIPFSIKQMMEFFFLKEDKKS